ncbi:MAG: hypothetical protein F9K22_07995 [Bacteroidetes bacterium]|nr:MAG: hypothetical protein F9K22_07995 [Bacteroidota bacterium]
MKKLLLALLAASPFLCAQNPDGRNASLHVTPSWLWGTSDYQRVTGMWYPPTQASDAQTVYTTDLGLVDHPYAFGVNAMLKVPAASFLTMSIAYSFQQHFQEYGTKNAAQPYFSQYWSLNGKLHSVSVTMSVYNLFSLYQD